jgi:putative acyl-CoA dehydrogenase
VELMAVALEASLLLRHGDPAVAEAFCASRLDGIGARSFGTLPPSARLAGIVERHRPRT